MAQDIVNENQKISYTNLDFSSIYTEVIDLIKQLTYRWDPSISNESDPGVVLVKLSSLIADKCNYNIDKNILETFPLSVTQNGNARQLYDQLGYYMDWYESASVPVLISWIGETTDSSASYTIPKFTAITDAESSHVYSLIGAEGVDGVVVSDTILPADGNVMTVIAMEGTPVQYQFENETVITAQMVDPISRRLYFPHSYVSQNGVFVKNTDQENYASWKRVNNLYENSYNELRYVFGYDSNTDTCFLEFPDNYPELFGSGIEITYLVVPQETSDIPAQSLNQFLAPISIGEGAGIVLDSSNVKITNYVAASGHKDIESIDDAYVNYKRTVGTFKTLITLRDYLNYIRSTDIDICSNAFVCDRTNDIQSTYRIMSNQHDLDTIIVKVEQVIDNDTVAESSFDYKFIKTTDSSVVAGKTYYKIINNELSEVDTSTGSFVPREEGWYELESIEPKKKDALTPFSLKFYLLRKAISLNSKTAYNQTFSMMKPYPDFDSLLEDTSHLEHIYEDILPLGKNSFIKSEDGSWLSDKSYWLYDTEEDSFTLIGDTEVFDLPPADNSNVYEIDVEALLPHTVMFKGVYPVILNISTYNIVDEDTQADITSNIISSLYTSVNSSQVDFGLPISVEYLVEVAKNSDDRIKSITIDPIEYSLYATYYDKDEDLYIDVEIDHDMSIYAPSSYRSMTDLVAALIKKDVVCKSILAGTTQLLVPDKTFIYHLSQKYIDYVDNISNITGEAIIDIRNDSVTSYSLDDSDSFIRKAYTLKDNETVSIYRPSFKPSKTFTNNVHFEYLLYNDIAADSSYKLGTNEFFILYTPIKDADNTSIVGYTVYSCGTGAIIHSTFDIKSQTSLSALSGFAKARVIPYFTVNPTQNYYELSTYNENYKTEIRNSSAIINNAISGTNEISIEEVSTITIDRQDKYKFFWILSEPTYSNNLNLKSYTLFDTFDSVNDNKHSDTINTYTLRNGEALFYTNEAGTDFAMLGPGTTLIRNCGVESSEYAEIENSLYFVNANEVNHILLDANFDFVTDENQVIRPAMNGLYEVASTPDPVELSADANPYAMGLYERIIQENNTVYYTPTYNTEVMDGVSYFKPEFVKTYDESYVSGKFYYVLVMRKESGWYVQSTVTDDNGVAQEVYVADAVDTGCFKEVNLYTNNELANPKNMGLYEIATYNKNNFIDSYSLNDDSQATSHNRFTNTDDTSIIDRQILSGTKYSSINLTDIGSYTSINMADMVSTSPETLGLLIPTYKTYYTSSTGAEEAIVTYLSNPNALGLYESYIDPETSEQSFVATTDTTPEIISIKKTASIELLSEVNSIFTDNMYNSGYYYKPSSINYTYYYGNLSDKLSNSYYRNLPNYSVPYLDAGTVLTEYEGAYNRSPLSYLYYLFINTTQPESLAGHTQLAEISNRWATAITYQPPYSHTDEFSTTEIYNYDDVVIYESKSYRCIVAQSTMGSFMPSEWVEVDIAWAVYNFTTGGTLASMGTDYDNKYIKVRSDSIIDKSIIVNNIYPCFSEGDTEGSPVTSRFYIPAMFYPNYQDGDAGLVDNINYYVLDTNNKFDYLDSDLKLARLFPNSKNDISNYGTVHIFFLPKLYKFNDFVRYTYKNYYEPKVLYNRNCGEIKAWSCTALDNDYIREDPQKNIGDLWTSLQTNTSLTIIENNIESFASGDTLIFEASEQSESYVAWPTFSNTEIILDLDAYKVSYQRKGGDIKDLSDVDVDNYAWRGYSALMLNTSSTSGQKLEYNHSLKLYDSEYAEEPISTLYGSAYNNLTFQLKYPVENKSGTFIDVSTVDMLGENINNKLYAFTPFANDTYYAYDTSNYKTYLYFNSNEPSGGSTSYSPQTIVLPIGLPSGNYLLGMDMKSDINLTIDYINRVEGVTASGGGVNCPIDAPAADTGIAYNDMHYGFDENFHNYLHSYVDDNRIKFTNDKYDYIQLNIGSTYHKIKVPSLITFMFNKSPYEMGWYTELNGEYIKADSSYSGKGSEILEAIQEQTYPTGSGINPSEEGWYDKIEDVAGDYYVVTQDTSYDGGKVYYKEPELYVSLSDVKSYLNFTIDDDSAPATYSILDIFKYENNPALGNGFNDIREKIKQLDVDEEFNYMFTPTANDLIENPLDPKSFWNSNHVYNNFIIPQLNFDNLSTRYITTKMNR